MVRRLKEEKTVSSLLQSVTEVDRNRTGVASAQARCRKSRVAMTRTRVLAGQSDLNAVISPAAVLDERTHTAGVARGLWRGVLDNRLGAAVLRDGRGLFR